MTARAYHALTYLPRLLERTLFSLALYLSFAQMAKLRGVVHESDYKYALPLIDLRLQDVGCDGEGGSLICSLLLYKSFLKVSWRFPVFLMHSSSSSQSLSPTTDFRNLELESPQPSPSPVQLMPPTTRRRALAEQQQRLQLQQSTQQPSHNVPAAGSVEMGNHLTSSRSDITYNVESLSARARQRASDGFDHVDIKLSRYNDHEADGYFVLGFTEHVSIRIGNERSNYSTPRCSCGACEEGLACKVHSISQTAVNWPR